MASTSMSCDFASGWISGMAGLVVGHPLDTVKVQQQILGKPMLESVVNIHRAGGMFTFFRGMGVPLLSEGAINSIYFGFYGATLDFLAEWRRSQRRIYSSSGNEHKQNSRHFHVESHWDYFIAGCVGGAAQLIIACPRDLIKIQLQNQIEKNLLKKGPINCIVDIIDRRGIRGLYKGFTVQAWRDVPISGFYFTSYEFLKVKLNFGSGQQSTILSQFVAGGTAGILSWWAITPLDVIKSRIQGELEHSKKYRGIIHCGSVVLKTHGFRGLFRGFLPLSLQAFPVNGTIFLVYEWLFQHCKEHETRLYS